MDRPHERLLGTILVVLGVVILLFAFYHAYTLMGHLPSSGSSTPPQAAFDFAVSGFTVTLTDHSRAGSSPITSTYWTFEDGNTSSLANVSHTYAKAGTYNVTLVVEDKSGYAEMSAAPVHVGPGATGNGVGSPSVAPGGSLGSVIGDAIGGPIGTIAWISENFILLVVFWMVGGTILRAGWNLITPKAETIQVRVKPKSLTVEGAGYSAMPQAGPYASPTSSAAMAGTSSTAGTSASPISP